MPPPSDLVLASNTRSAGVSTEYAEWLRLLADTCRLNNIVFILDEVYTGFRLAPGGAQEYWGVKADMVVYGKTLGGGFPIGVVCGPSSLMARTDAQLALRVNYVVGTFAAHPMAMSTMYAFLKWVKSDEATKKYDELNKRVPLWIKETNVILADLKLPLEVASYATVWTMLYKQPSRYHWMLQCAHILCTHADALVCELCVRVFMCMCLYVPLYTRFCVHVHVHTYAQVLPSR